MMLQNLIVIAIIAAAVIFAGVTLLRKRRAFSVKNGCSHDCGCGGGSKKLNS